MLISLIFIIAVFTSVISALIGIGGGLLLVPSLTTLAKLPHIHAAGTALAAMTIFSAIASIKNHKNNFIIWSVAILIACGSIIGAIIGAYFSIQIPIVVWKTGFVIIALYLAYNMLFQKKSKKTLLATLYTTLNKLPLRIYSKSLELNISISGFLLFGVILGIISSILGLGGGFLTTPFFMLGMKITPKKAVASSIVVIFLTSLSGAVSHISLGHFSLNFWAAATLGMAVGGYVGAEFLKKIPDKSIKYIFTSIVLFAILLIILK